MKATELRLGNWVLSDHIPGSISGNENHPYKISWINGDDDDYTPIPLTADIFEKAGFDNYNKLNTRYSLTVMDYCELVFGKFEHEPNGDFRLEVDYTDYYLPHIKSVHELQNLYFALTGSELEISL